MGGRAQVLNLEELRSPIDVEHPQVDIGLAGKALHENAKEVLVMDLGQSTLKTFFAGSQNTSPRPTHVLPLLDADDSPDPAHPSLADQSAALVHWVKNRARAALRGQRCRGVLVGLPVALGGDRPGGRCTYAPLGREVDLLLDLATAMEALMGPSMPTRFVNDAVLAAMAWRTGADEASLPALILTLGTGPGAALVTAPPVNAT
jgi:hypothetical protein